MTVLTLLPILTFSAIVLAAFVDLKATEVAIRSDDRSQRRFRQGGGR